MFSEYVNLSQHGRDDEYTRYDTKIIIYTL
jgi:hypothetical protein